MSPPKRLIQPIIPAPTTGTCWCRIASSLEDGLECLYTTVGPAAQAGRVFPAAKL